PLALRQRVAKFLPRLFGHPLQSLDDLGVLRRHVLRLTRVGLQVVEGELGLRLAVAAGAASLAGSALEAAVSVGKDELPLAVADRLEPPPAVVTIEGVARAA